MGAERRLDGYEYPLLLVVVLLLGLALAGPGRWSVDSALGLTPWPGRLTAGCAAFGVVSGLLTRLALHRAPVVDGARAAL